ncbi:MarR family winged helix-turn-helix transcriptional regulator [Streptomyces sp. CB02400]|uniref:MarR family winged helix-turn-helix transcriptional regulator n=1 Tax=Streptomyces sp. CB02400 TaxID=1703944 RepID=UPI00093EA772|nr:MarR family transcriptional regulator [Streptomyces sp. CB02400]OKK05062.1 MarR family transcriptional regulator [Streptomyces sp. CB02400]
MSDDAVLTKRWSTLTRVHRRIETRIGRCLHQHLGLGTTEFYALRALREGTRAGAGSLYLNDLANEIGLSQSATSRLVGRLQDRGLITVQTSSRDRRSVDIELSVAADDVLRRGVPLLHQAVGDVVRELGGEKTDEVLLRYLRGDADDAALRPDGPVVASCRATA